jgi:hypothetical protein
MQGNSLRADSRSPHMVAMTPPYCTCRWFQPPGFPFGREKVSAAMQKQALSANRFLCEHVLETELQGDP